MALVVRPNSPLRSLCAAASTSSLRVMACAMRPGCIGLVQGISKSAAAIQRAASTACAGEVIVLMQSDASRPGFTGQFHTLRASLQIKAGSASDSSSIHASGEQQRNRRSGGSFLTKNRKTLQGAERPMRVMTVLTLAVVVFTGPALAENNDRVKQQRRNSG